MKVKVILNFNSKSGSPFQNPRLKTIPGAPRQTFDDDVISGLQENLTLFVTVNMEVKLPLNTNGDSLLEPVCGNYASLPGGDITMTSFQIAKTLSH